MSERLASRCHQSSSLVTELHQKQHNALIHLSHQITGNFTRGGKLICAGQGLLHTVAQHMAACFTHQLSFERPMLPAVALGDPLLATSLLASGQAHEYLAREYRLYRGEDHLLILFSTALPSVEIKHLAEQVEDDQNLVVIGPEGASKLLSKSAASQPLLLPGESLPRLIELALLSTHLLCELVEGELFGV